MRDPDTEAEASAGHFVDISRTRRELLGRLGIDRRDRSAEPDLLGGQYQTGALCHIAVPARHINAGKAAPLYLAREIEDLMAPSRYGDEADRRERLRH